MSTRAFIKIEGITYAKVYKHHDGYPEGTLPWLKAFNESFAKERGDDPDYKFAQLLRSSARDQAKFNLDPGTVTGWGVIAYDVTGWEEYEYLLKADGTVEVKEV